MNTNLENQVLKKRDASELYNYNLSCRVTNSKDYSIITSSRDRNLNSWEVSNSRNSNFQLVNKSKDSWVNSMNITPDGKTLFCANFDYLKQWCLESNKVLKDFGKMPDNKVIRRVQITPDSKYLFIGFYDSHIEQWDLKYNKLIKNYGKTHDNYLICMKISNDGMQLFTGSRDGRVKHFSISKRK